MVGTFSIRKIHNDYLIYVHLLCLFFFKYLSFVELLADRIVVTDRARLVRPARSKSICNTRMHIHVHALPDTRPQSARVRWPDGSPPLRAIIGQKARGMTGTGHLIMSASAAFVTQTASRCYWGPGRNMQRKPCNLPLMPWQQRQLAG